MLFCLFLLFLNCGLFKIQSYFTQNLAKIWINTNQTITLTEPLGLSIFFPNLVWNNSTFLECFFQKYLKNRKLKGNSIYMKSKYFVVLQTYLLLKYLICAWGIKLYIFLKLNITFYFTLHMPRMENWMLDGSFIIMLQHNIRSSPRCYHDHVFPS